MRSKTTASVGAKPKSPSQKHVSFKDKIQSGSSPEEIKPDKAIEAHATLLGAETSILKGYVGQAYDTIILSGDPDKSAWRHTFKGVEVTKWFIPAEYRSVSLAERISRWTVCVPVDAMGASQPRFVLEQKVFDENGFEETVLLQPRLSSLRNDTVYIFAGCGDEIAEVGSSDLHITFKQLSPGAWEAFRITNQVTYGVAEGSFKQTDPKPSQFDVNVHIDEDAIQADTFYFSFSPHFGITHERPALGIEIPGEIMQWIDGKAQMKSLLAPNLFQQRDDALVVMKLIGFGAMAQGAQAYEGDVSLRMPLRTEEICVRCGHRQ